MNEEFDFDEYLDLWWKNHPEFVLENRGVAEYRCKKCGGHCDHGRCRWYVIKKFLIGALYGKFRK